MKKSLLTTLALMAMPLANLFAYPGSVEYDEFRESSIDTTKWNATGTPFTLITDPTDPTDNIARLSGADIAGSFLSVNRSLSKVKGVQIKARANCATYYTNEEGVIGIQLDDGNWGFWMQINGESIGGVDGPTIEMVWENTSTGATDFRRERVSWDTWYELRILVDSVTGTVGFYYITPDQDFTTPNFSYNYGGTLPSGPSTVEIYGSVNNGDYVELDEARLLVDLQDITLSTSSPSVPEGATQTVTVTFPQNHPCDMPIIVTPEPAGDTDLTISPMSFTLTPSNTTQVLTLSASEDADGTNGTRIFDLDPHGTNNHAFINAVESDNDVPQIVVTPGSVTVMEGTTTQVAISLREYDGSEVPISVTMAGTDSDLSVTPKTFTLNSGNPNQIVTVTAAEDADSLDGAETFTFSSPGYSGATLTATESDNDVLRVIATPSSATIEGKTNSQGVMVQLTIDPGAPVTLAIARSSGDTDISCTPSIVLDSNNYNLTSNYLAVTAAEDDSDTEDDSAEFTITGAGDPVTFTATAVDDDITLTVNKTGSGSVTGGGIHDLDDAPFAITAVPTVGQRFISWTGPDVDNVLDAEAEVTVIAALDDATVTAQFTSPSDDDDEWYEGGCNMGSGCMSMLTLVMIIVGLIGVRTRRR